MNKPQKGCNLEKCFLCSNTVPEWRETINLHKQNLKFKKGEVIFSEGQPVTGIYFVYSGAAKVHKKWGNDIKFSWFAKAMRTNLINKKRPPFS